MVLVDRRSCLPICVCRTARTLFLIIRIHTQKTPQACAWGVCASLSLLDGDVELDDRAHRARECNDGSAGLDGLEAGVRLVRILGAAL